MKNHQLQIGICPIEDLLAIAAANAFETITSIRQQAPSGNAEDIGSLSVVMSVVIRMLFQRMKGAVGGKVLSSFRNIEREARANGWRRSLMNELVMKDVEEAASLGILCGALALKQTFADHLADHNFTLAGPLDEAMGDIHNIKEFSQELFCKIVSIETLMGQYMNDLVVAQVNKEGRDFAASDVRCVLLSPTVLVGILSPDTSADVITSRHVAMGGIQNATEMGRLWLEEIAESLLDECEGNNQIAVVAEAALRKAKIDTASIEDRLLGRSDADDSNARPN